MRKKRRHLRRSRAPARKWNVVKKQFGEAHVETMDKLAMLGGWGVRINSLIHEMLTDTLPVLWAPTSP